MPDYKDPKVTTTENKKNDTTKWVGIAVAVLLLLLLLAWLFGWFSSDDEVQVIDPATVEEPVAIE